LPHEEKSCGNGGKQEACFPPFPQHDYGGGYLFFNENDMAFFNEIAENS